MLITATPGSGRDALTCNVALSRRAEARRSRIAA
jgi:hypothetical protein